jgi:hypothetical protein
MLPQPTYTFAQRPDNAAAPTRSRFGALALAPSYKRKNAAAWVSPGGGVCVFRNARYFAVKAPASFSETYPKMPPITMEATTFMIGLALTVVLSASPTWLPISANAAVEA